MAEEQEKNIETSENEVTNTTGSGLAQESFLDKAGEFFQGKAKYITIAVGAVIVVILGYLGYQKFIVEPNNEESAQAIYLGESYLVDSKNFNAAIEGDSLGLFPGGLASVAKKWDGYAGGNLAYYDMGIAYMNAGDPASAIKAFKKVEFDDEHFGTMLLGAQGDCHAQLGNYAKAVEFYEEAYHRRPKNQLTAPLYMMKLAGMYELEKNYSEAEEIYTDLIENFPNSSMRDKAEKYRVLVQAGTSAYDLP